MKKLLSLTVMLALALFANAENRKWDFTSWSQATIDNLAADMAANSGANWSDTEKAGGTSTNAACYWWVPAGVSSMVTTTGGVENAIPELAGLDFAGYKARALAIAINYPETSLGTYAGPSYLWLGSKSQSFKIPSVKPGAKITMQVESHKPSEGRGVGLSVNGTAITISEGSEKPKELTTCVWYIPSDISDAETVDVTVTQNNGCHLYSIEVSEDAAAVENAKIAYVFNSQADGYNANDDLPRCFIEYTDRFENTTFDALDVASDLSAVTADSLKGYNVVVVSSTVPADNSYVSVLKQAIAYVPMLNLNANLYAAWGYGEAVTTTATSMDIDNKYQSNSLFDPSATTNGDSWVVDGKVALFNSTPIVGVKYPADGYFADDDTIATAGDAIAMHIHNADRNPYMFLAMPTDNADYANEEAAEDVIVNAVTLLNYKKTAVPQAAAPTFTNTYKQQNTDVAIKSSISGAKIYYTTDGTEPSDASTLYTEPINVTTDNTIISAVAYADGYSVSEVAKDTVRIYETAQKPVISVEQQEGKSVVTLTTDEAGATIYYNITGSNAINESSVYSEPIELTNRTELYAFTGAANDKIQSELVSQIIDIQGKQIRIDEVSHFDANAADWGNGGTGTFYYTEGKKNGYNYYNIIDTTHVTASDGITDSLVYTVEPANKVTYYNPGKGWELKSYGQGALWEKISPSNDIDDTNTTKRYRPETAFDCGVSKYDVTFGNVQKSNGTSNDPYSCSIQSTEAFQGPIDIVAFIGNASGSNQPKGVICVSTDTTDVNNWVELDTIMCSKTQRWIKKHIVSYEGTEKVFVKLQAAFSSLMVFDIYVYNHGTKSEEATGIVNIQSDEKAAAGNVVRTIVYNVDGRQLAQPTKGINIIKQVYANGAVKTKKVVVK